MICHNKSTFGNQEVQRWRADCYQLSPRLIHVCFVKLMFATSVGSKTSRFGHFFSDIIDRVKCPQGDTLYRPSLPNHDDSGPEGTSKGREVDKKHSPSVPELMSQCWEEDPMSRPSFERVNHILRKMFKNRYSEDVLQEHSTVVMT